MRFHQHTVIGVFTLFAGPLAYFLIYALLSSIFTNMISHLFAPTFQIRLVYLVILFNLGHTYAIEKIYKQLTEKVGGWWEDREAK